MDNGRRETITYSKFMELIVPTTIQVDVPYPGAPPNSAFMGPETTRYSHMCAWIHQALVGTEFVIRDTADRPDNRNDSLDCRPDLCIYRANNDRQLTEAQRKRSKMSDSRKPWASRCDLSEAILPIEIKCEGDPFSNDGGAAGKKSRGQIAEVMAEIMTRQHRTHVYSVYIFNRHAYLLFWDRTGTVVSEPIVITTPDGAFKLFRFLCIVGRMSDVQLGYDPTVQRVGRDDPDVVKMKAFVPADAYHAEYLTALTESEWPLHRVTVHTDGAPDQRFVIGTHRSVSQSVYGRGTQGYVAYDPVENRLCFLKQAWRADHSSINPEYTTYKLLHEAGVRNIATPICGGDVKKMDGTRTRTIAQKFLKTPQIGRILHRFVVKEVGRPLRDYKNSKELVTIVGHALEAHQDAWEKSDILHRDVSEANILIYEYVDGNERKLKGILNDWDMCKTKSQLKIQPGQPNRTGTWIFLSARILNFPDLPYTLSDDLESFFYVLLWMGFRYHMHDRSDKPSRLESFLFGFFEEFDEDLTAKSVLGSRDKLQAMKKGSISLDFLPPTSPGFIGLIDTLLQVCKEHYSDMRPDRFTVTSQVEGGDVSTSTTTLHSAVQVPSPSGLLYDHQRMISTISHALQVTAHWSTSDKREDQLPKRQKLLAVSSSTNHGGSACSSSKRKTSNEGVSSVESRNTRQRISRGTISHGEVVAGGVIQVVPGGQ